MLYACSGISEYSSARNKGFNEELIFEFCSYLTFQCYRTLSKIFVVT